MVYILFMRDFLIIDGCRIFSMSITDFSCHSPCSAGDSFTGVSFAAGELDLALVGISFTMQSSRNSMMPASWQPGLA
jgi:hypothetical protein